MACRIYTGWLVYLDSLAARNSSVHSYTNTVTLPPLNPPHHPCSFHQLIHTHGHIKINLFNAKLVKNPQCFCKSSISKSYGPDQSIII